MELFDHEMTRDLRGAAFVFPQFEKEMRVGLVRHTNTRRLEEMRAILKVGHGANHSPNPFFVGMGVLYGLLDGYCSSISAMVESESD